MAILANTSLFFLSPSKHSNPIPQYSIFSQTQITHNPKKLALNALSQSSQVPRPLNIEYLKREFAGPGISFQAVGELGCVVKLETDNGSLANVMLPSGVITSYVPHMWHGAGMEMLHTTVSDGGVIKGGISIDIKSVEDCEGGDSVEWARQKWMLHGVNGSPREYIQIELVSLSPLDLVEAQCTMTLTSNQISTELTITNPKPTPLKISAQILNHLKVSTPEASYMVGMQGSTYRDSTGPPLTSEFNIVPPHMRKDDLERGEEEEEEEEEEIDYASLNDEMHRFYRHAPRQFGIIDRGKRYLVTIGRSGFEEVYVMSPGSNYDWYGRYAYVCVGPITGKSISLGPGGVWRGSQVLFNPNVES